MTAKTPDADKMAARDRLLRDALVRSGWAEALMLERLGPDQSRELLADHLAAQVEDARAALKPLTPWPAQPERVTKVLDDDGNQSRVRRTLEYLMPGDRVLEIGVGFGQVSGLMMRDTGISGYTGIDIEQHRLDAVHQMAEKNGLDHLDITTALVDLADLTPEWVAERRPDLIMCEEVLEHVPDAEGALAALSRSMPPGCCVLFTVPVLGRIEACWGHLSLFDVARVRRMLADAGLVAQHVEVVYDAWLFVLASASEAVPERVVRLASLPRPTPPEPPAAVPTFIPVDLGDTKAVNGAVVTRDGKETHVHFAGRRTRGKQDGGLTFDIAGDIALRLELRVDNPKDIQRLFVDFYDRDGNRTARWTWDRSRSRMAAGKARTYVLKPGEPFGPFRPDGEVTGARATTAGILVEISGKSSARFSVLRAAAVEEKQPPSAS
jgi:2-polyprenyl-3-methyl-5-hydroxy-6-metoxy-1,4-benzoquinol methylase